MWTATTSCKRMPWVDIQGILFVYSRISYNRGSITHRERQIAMITLDIFTDGAARGGGKPTCITGWSFVIPDFMGKRFIRYGHLPAPSTRNKAEIMGVLQAVSTFSQQSKFGVRISSDSQYVVNSCNIWRHGWGPEFNIKNRKLLLPLFNIIDAAACPLEIKWVKGHVGIVGNELADEYANYGRDMKVYERNDHIANVKFIPPEEVKFDFRPD